MPRVFRKKRPRRNQVYFGLGEPTTLSNHFSGLGMFRAAGSRLATSLEFTAFVAVPVLKGHRSKLSLHCSGALGPVPLATDHVAVRVNSFVVRFEKMSDLRYPWQQTLLDAFMELNPEHLAAKINIAERAISERLCDSTSTDVEEGIALRDALQSLRVLLAEVRERNEKVTERKELSA